MGSLDPADSAEGFRSLVPDNLISLDPSQTIDYTGTIENGGRPMESLDLGEGHENGNGEGFAATRMVDDDYYHQIQSIFPAESGSASGSQGEVPLDADRDQPSKGAESNENQTLSIQGIRADNTLEEFIPPIRDIRFPSDTASLEQLKQEDPDLDGEEYQIVNKLGEGGYGIVFEAEQTTLNRPVAVKVLKPRRKRPGSKGITGTGTGTGETQRRQTQFLHEAKITARLQHPNIVPLYDFGINPRGELFYSMKKVERRPWSSLIYSPAKLLGVGKRDIDADAERAAVGRNVEIFSKVCDAIAYAHSRKIIHRDLKPDNIMIGDYGEVLLIDFGMALDLARRPATFSAGGTLVYMSPEMAEHFAKQREIQVVAHKTAGRLGEDRGSVFLDQSNLLGVGKLAEQLMQETDDTELIELAKQLIQMDAEEKVLANKITTSSDIYLLGAILYQIAVGHPPHYFPIDFCKSAGQSKDKAKREKFQKELWLALRNGFQQWRPVEDPLRVSLRNIAMKAMTTDPAERFQTVEELQEEISRYQLQVQSLEMTETGRDEVAKSKGRSDYQHLLPALESFRGARALWPEGTEARDLQIDSACEYGSRAHQRKDFDAGLDIIDEYVDDELKGSRRVTEVRKKLEEGKRKRARNRRLGVAASLAAVILPIATFIGVTAYTAVQVNDAIAKRDEAKESAAGFEQAAEDAKNQAKVAQNLLGTVEDDLEEAKNALTAADEAKKKAEGLARTAENERKAAAALAKEANENYIEVQGNLTKVQQQLTQASTGLKDANKKLGLATDAKVAAENLAKEAAKEASVAQAKAQQFKFDAEFGDFNKYVLPIPLDLRKGNNEEARQKLQDLLDSESKPYFKNGWLVRHYAKRINVEFEGTELAKRALGPNTEIVDLVSAIESTAAIAVARQNETAQIWRLVVGEDPQQLEWELPEYACTVTSASLSSDGKWLAMSLDEVAAENDHLWIIDTESGKRVALEASEDAIVGCQEVQFAMGENAMDFVSVEERAGYQGLKKRLQVVTRRMENGQVKVVGQPQRVSATSRDQDSTVTYLADIRADEAGTSVAIAYQSLSDKGRDNVRMETLTSADGGNWDRDRIEIAAFPTSLHVGPDRQLYCGHPNGAIDTFQVGSLSRGALSSVNQNENRVVEIATTMDGRLISGSENGVIIVWNRRTQSGDLEVVKRLDGQPGELSSLVLAENDPANGFAMFTGAEDGNIRYWQPASSKHDASIQRGSGTVTCGAIDGSVTSSEIAPIAYGTASGEVYYFDTQSLKQGDAGERIAEEGVGANATFRFPSPFEEFDVAFDDFDAMGIVGDRFVLIKKDGRFFQNSIDARDPFVSPQSTTFQLTKPNELAKRFVPLMASRHDQDYFFTTNPRDASGLLFWKVTNGQFSARPLKSSGTGGVKRMRMSPDGNWLAVVRQVELDKTTGEYRVEFFEVDPSTTDILTLASQSKNYRVGDPAFADFSPNSDELILHTHKLGTDRETWVEHWKLADGKWTGADSMRRLVDDQKVNLVAWNGDSEEEKLITRINKKFFLAGRRAEEKADQREPDFQAAPFQGTDLISTRGIFPTGSGSDYYVLSKDRIEKYEETEQTAQKWNMQNATSLRVFGDRAIVLDDRGFHLFNSDLEYVTKLAARRTPVKELSLANGRLAITYGTRDDSDAGGFCRIWDVSGDQPKGLGVIDNVQSVQISADGMWAACRIQNEVKIYRIDSPFENENVKVAVSDESATQWIGGEQPRLLIGEATRNGQAENADLSWAKINPANGEKEAIDILLPTQASGIDGFALSPITENYLALHADGAVSLWAVSAEFAKDQDEDGKPDALRLSQAEGFNESKYTSVQSVSFSEIEADDESEVGTRLLVFEKSGDKLDLSIFLLAKEDPQALPEIENAAGEEEAAEAGADEQDAIEMIARYRALEIEGALDVLDGRNLTGASFSGDGKTLLEVDDKGVTALISK